MASESVGGNDNRDLNARERRRWADNSKVYTRRFRGKDQLTSGSDNPATEPEPTVAVASEPTVPTSPAKSQICGDKVGLQPSPRESQAAEDGNSLQPQPQRSASRSEGESWSCDAVRQPEGGRGFQEVVPNDGEEPLPSGGQEALPLLRPSGGEETLPSDLEEPTLSSGHEAPHQLKSPGGLEPIPSDREELPLPEETFSELLPSGGEWALPDGREELQPSRGQTEVPNSREELQSLPSEREDMHLSGGQVTMPSGGEGPHAHGHGSPVKHVTPTVLVNGVSKPVITWVEDRVRISVSGSTSKGEFRGIKRKLESELDSVRSLVKKLESKELQVTAYNASNINSYTNCVGSAGNYGGYNQTQLMRVQSDVGSVRHQDLRPFRHLTVSVMEKNHGVGEFIEKEKRTPKANQYYRNSEFLLGKDRLPSESNKKLKPNGAGKKHGVDVEYGLGFGADKNRDKMFRSCSNLLQRLMKHKHAWVFNEPVDAQKLNIPDYHDIIKHPMDFGTIKNRLSQNWYKSAREFAEDVRLVFRNAMTYNPKGQDVHSMAEELSIIFEDRWTAIEKEYFPYQMYYDAGLPIPTPRKAPPPLVRFPVTPAAAPARSAPARSAPPMRTLDRSESITMSVDPKLRPSNIRYVPHVGRTPVPKKPKAKDPNKRDMTYEEKQKLSTKLQSLPSEKLDAIVEIIKKRNSSLSQHNDEIEVDIDSVDAETLWELDRFVTNYKKSLSKNKRKAELAQQARAEAAQSVPMMNPAPAVVDTQKERRTGENINPPPVQVEKRGDNVSGSSSSSSSSSDSGSSSSDSDSDSSSGYESDAGHSPRT